LDILDTLWHLLNFFLPAAGVGALAAGLAKLVWRRRLAPVPWHRLAAWAAGGATLALLAGLLMFGRDGRMSTYAMVVASSAAALWWAGLRGR
jgi:hypothetical protein